MRRCATVASLMLVRVAVVSSAADRLTDPTRDFVEGYDPSQNDFFANPPERTVLLRISARPLDLERPADRSVYAAHWPPGEGRQWNTASCSTTAVIRRVLATGAGPLVSRYTWRP